MLLNFLEKYYTFLDKLRATLFSSIFELTLWILRCENIQKLQVPDRLLSFRCLKGA